MVCKRSRALQVMLCRHGGVRHEVGPLNFSQEGTGSHQL